MQWEDSSWRREGSRHTLGDKLETGARATARRKQGFQGAPWRRPSSFLIASASGRLQVQAPRVCPVRFLSRVSMRSDSHTAPCYGPHHPLIFWVQLWCRFTPYILQKQMGSRGNREGGPSLSKCSYSRFRPSVLFQPMVPWWAVNLSWQKGSNKTNQLYGTFKLKGLVILGETGFLHKRQKQSQWNQVVGFFLKIERIDKALSRLTKKIREKAQMNNSNKKTQRGEIILDDIEIQEIIRTFTCQKIGQSRKKWIHF